MHIPSHSLKTCDFSEDLACATIVKCVKTAPGGH